MNQTSQMVKTLYDTIFFQVHIGCKLQQYTIYLLFKKKKIKLVKFFLLYKSIFGKTF